MNIGNINLLVNSGRIWLICYSVLREISFLEIISSLSYSDHYSIEIPFISESIFIYAGTILVLKYSLLRTTAG
jgi:hypothetical protein